MRPFEPPTTIWSDSGFSIDVLPSEDLANSSFLVVDLERAEAAVVDPTRDISRYIDRARQMGVAITWVLDTHLHSDFVSGGDELAATVGATRGRSTPGPSDRPFRVLRGGERLALGSGEISVVRSPGHSPDHVSFLLRNARGHDQVLLSGGSLMAGTAGRPDLLGDDRTPMLVREEYRTLHERFRDIDDRVVVLPTHLGGSFCASSARPEPRTELGIERRTNPLFLVGSGDVFRKAYVPVSPFPRYYEFVRTLNAQGGRSIGRTVGELPALAPAEVARRLRETGTTVLDVRDAAAFDAGHLPGSLSVPVDGPFAAWVGWLRNEGEKFVFIDDGPAQRTAAHLALLRIGFDHVEGHLAGGFAAYARSRRPVARTARIPLAALPPRTAGTSRGAVVDVRYPYERAAVSVPGSVSFPLPELPSANLERLDRRAPVFAYCASGWRAGIAASVLEARGFTRVTHIIDGLPAPAAPAVSPAAGGTG